MNKILIITTEGCEACEIAKANINEAVNKSNVSINIDTEDWHKLTKKFIISNKIKDFPAALYMVDGNVVNKAIGTYPVVVYLHWIKLYFKN